jgi:hypothetical protein
MRFARDWFLLAACNVVLLAVTAMVNDGLAAWNVSLFLAGLCMVRPVMKLPPASLLLCAVLSGLAGDAQLPTPPGFLMTLFVLGAGFIIVARPWLGQMGRTPQIALACLLNAGYFLAFTWWAAARGGATGAAFWERAALDFCVSQLILLPVGIWFFEFQECVLALAGSAAAGPAAATSR